MQQNEKLFSYNFLTCRYRTNTQYLATTCKIHKTQYVEQHYNCVAGYCS